MAFTASCVWEVESGGSDTVNGGGFDTGVAGFPTDGAVASSNTSAPVFSSASYNFTSADVTTPPAWVYLKSGTSLIPGWYAITALSGNSAVLDAAIGHAVLAAGTPNTVVGCCTTGTSLSTITWGADYSQSTATRISLDDMIVGATTTQFTSVHTPVGVNFIGNIISVTSGATVQRVAVISTATTTATCDKTLGTAAQVGVGQVGGAFASPGAAAGLALLAGNSVHIKTATYVMTTSSSNVAVGVVSVGNVANQLWQGYATVRGDDGTPPILQIASSGVTSVTVFAHADSTGRTVIRNIKADGQAKSSIRGFSLNQAMGDLLIAIGCTNTGITGGSIYRSLVSTCTGGTGAFLGQSLCFLCVATANTVTGFASNSPTTFSFCLSYSNTGTTDGFSIVGNGQATLSSCIAYANGRDGFRFAFFSSALNGGYTFNCIAESNTGFGFSGATATRYAPLVSCAAFSNSGGNVDPLVGGPKPGFVTGGSSFFIAAASGNFALNNKSGAGAACRAAGIPGIFPSGTTTGYQDIGAAQSRVPWQTTNLVGGSSA